MTMMKASDWARERGFSRAYAYKLIKLGGIPFEQGKVDAEMLDAVQQSRQPVNRPQSRPLATSTSAIASTLPSTHEDGKALNTMLLKSRIKTELQRSRLLSIRVKQETGEWIKRAAVEKALFTLSRTTRDQLLTIPDRLASVLATLLDAKSIHEVLSREIRQVLEALCEFDVDVLAQKSIVNVEETL